MVTGKDNVKKGQEAMKEVAAKSGLGIHVTKVNVINSYRCSYDRYVQDVGWRGGRIYRHVLCFVLIWLFATLVGFGAGNETRVTFINSQTNEKIGEYEYPQYALFSGAPYAIWNTPNAIWNGIPASPGVKANAAGWVDAKTGRFVHDYDMANGEVTELKSAIWYVQSGDKDYDIECHGEIRLVPRGQEMPSISTYSSSSDLSLDYERLKDAISQQSDERDITGIAVWISVGLNGVYQYELRDDGDLHKKLEHGTFSGIVNLITYAPNGTFSRQKIGNVSLSTNSGGVRGVNMRHFIPIDEIELGNDYKFHIEVVKDSSGQSSPLNEWNSSIPLPLSMSGLEIIVSAQAADVAGGSLTLSWRARDPNKDLSEREFSVWRSSGLKQDGRSIRKETVKCIKEKVIGTNFIDTTFGVIPGSDVVRYWIVPKGSARWRDNGHPKLAYSIDTRRRVCLSVGLDFYERAQSQNIKGHEHDKKEAELFAQLIENGGGIVADDGTWYEPYPVEVLTGAAATPNAFTNYFTWLSNKCNPGDVFFLYIATHGVAPSSGDSAFSNPTFALYADPNSADPDFKKGHFTNLDMARLLVKVDLKGKGVKFIGVHNTCYSGDFVSRFKDITEFDNTAWIASSASGNEAKCGDLYSRFGVVFLNWGWHGMEAKRDSIIMKGGATVSVRNNKDDRQLDLLEIANYTELFLDHESSLNDALTVQGITIVNSELLGKTDVVDYVGDDVKFSSQSPRPDFQMSEDGRCMIFTPILQQEDCISTRFVSADFIPKGGHVTSGICYCPYPDAEDKIRRNYLLFTKDQAEYYNRGCLKQDEGVLNFVRKYNKIRVSDPAYACLESGTEYECRAWTISPAGWSTESLPKKFETMGMLKWWFMTHMSNNAEYYGVGKSRVISEPRLNSVRRLAQMASFGNDIVSVTIKPHRTIFYDYDDDDAYDESDDEYDESYEGEERVGFWAYVLDSEGNEYSYSASEVIDEKSVTIDENGNPVLELVFPSSLHDIGDLKVTLKGMEMYGKVGHYSFTGYMRPQWDEFKDDEFFYLDETLRAEALVYEPELTVTPPEINEEDLVFTVKLDARGGKASVNEITVRYGERYGDKLPTPTRNGFRFDGWYTFPYGKVGYDTPITTDSVAVANGTLYASWFYTGSGGDPTTQEDEIEGLEDIYGPFIPGVVYTNDFSDILPMDCKVTGLPTGMKWNAGLCAVIGAATKPSTNVVSFSYTEMDWYFYQKVAYKGTAKFVIGPYPTLSIERVGGDPACKINGAGAFAANAKVSLAAVASKGFVFAGWFADVECTLPYTDLGDFRTTKISGKMSSENIVLYARFAAAAADEESLKVTVEDVATEADGTIGTVGADGTRSFDFGAYVESLSLPKLAVSGLPAGLKYDAKTMKITGKATKPGVYTVKVTATNASVTGKNAVVETFNITVPNFRWNEETVGVALEDKYLLQAGVTPALSDEVAAITGAGWKLAVSGLPSGVKFDAKKGMLSGIATKEGFFTVYFTATRGKGKTAEKEVATATFEVVFPTLALSMAAWGDASATNKCKVAGGGRYPFGKKVTLKATPDKGKVFMGWYNGEEELVAQTASYSYVTTAEDVTFTAMFVTAEEDKASIALAVDGTEMRLAGDGSPHRTNIWAGVYLEWPVAASALSEPKVKVSGLPSGLKFTDKPVTSKTGSGKTAVTVTNVLANTIYGAPTAASKIDKNTGAAKPSAVKITVTTAGKSTQTYQIDAVVDALPAWAQGTFAGGGRGATALPGQVSLTVSAAGKVSGKALGGGFTYTLAAPYYIGFEEADGVSNFVADVTASWSYKEGTKTVKTNDVVQVAVADNGIGGYAAAEDWFEAYAANWKAEPWKTLGKSFDKTTLTYAILENGSFSEDEAALTAALGADVTGRVTLKFAASGAVSVAGEFVTGFDEKKQKYTTVKATGSATLVPVDDDHGEVFIYLTPKGLSPHARCVEVPLPPTQE